MTGQSLPPVEFLRELFNYNPVTGIITRKIARRRGKVGDTVGTLGKDGYLRVSIKWDGISKTYFVHRIGWCLHYGEDPVGMGLDHINRVKTDNRIENLRRVTQQENLRNRTAYGRVKEKYILTYHRGGYRVYVNNTHVGVRQTLEEAIELRDKYLANQSTQT